jgi:hypothetical protein
MCAFLALERQKPRAHGRAVFLYPRSGDKNTTSQAFRFNLFAAGRQKGFPLQSFASHGLTFGLNLLTVVFFLKNLIPRALRWGSSCAPGMGSNYAVKVRYTLGSRKC